MKVCGVTNSVCKMKFPTLYAIVEELGNAEVFDCVRLMLHRPVQETRKGKYIPSDNEAFKYKIQMCKFIKCTVL